MSYVIRRLEAFEGGELRTVWWTGVDWATGFPTWRDHIHYAVTIQRRQTAEAWRVALAMDRLDLLETIEIDEVLA